MTVKFTSPGVLSQITMPAGFQTLPNNSVSVSSNAESNDDSTQQFFFRNFAVKLGAQTARTSGAEVHLIIVPLLGTIVGDTGGNVQAAAYIATDKDGNKVTWPLPLTAAAVDLTWASVAIPNGDYYVGLINESTQTLGGTNEIWASQGFSVENRT